MEQIKYTDKEGLKYALSKFLQQTDLRYLNGDDIELILYTNANMSSVTNVKEGLDGLVVSVRNLDAKTISLEESISDLELADDEVLTKAKEYSNAILNLQTKLTFQIVDELPTTNISTNTIYLIPSITATGEECYEEYIYVDSEWSFIGKTETNLDDYYNKDYIDALFSALDKEISKKVDKEDGKSLISDELIARIENSEVYDDTEIKGLIDTKADNLFKTDMTTVTALGGIPSGTDLNNLSIQEVLTKLLYPYVAPTISATLIYSPSGGTYEYGQEVIVTGMKIDVTKKSEPITQINSYANGSVCGTSTGDIANGGSYTHNFSQSISITKSIANSYFQAKAIDASGKIVTANTVALNFYYPYYFGVVPVEEVITGDLVKNLTKQVSGKGTKSYSYTTDYERMLIAYPSSYGSLKSILDPNGFEQIKSFTKYTVEVVGLDGNVQNYYAYVNGASTNTNFMMKFYY